MDGLNNHDQRAPVYHIFVDDGAHYQFEQIPMGSARSPLDRFRDLSIGSPRMHHRTRLRPEELVQLKQNTQNLVVRLELDLIGRDLRPDALGTYMTPVPQCVHLASTRDFTTPNVHHFGASLTTSDVTTMTDSQPSFDWFVFALICVTSLFVNVVCSLLQNHY